MWNRNWWTSEAHDDIIKWKHFPRNWPFVRGIHWIQILSRIFFSIVYPWLFWRDSVRLWKCVWVCTCISVDWHSDVCTCICLIMLIIATSLDMWFYRKLVQVIFYCEIMYELFNICTYMFIVFLTPYVLDVHSHVWHMGLVRSQVVYKNYLLTCYFDRMYEHLHTFSIDTG